MTLRSDVLVIGAGPAGASTAILLAHAGWQVTLVEQHAYPRQKVCGECISATNYSLLDELGIGQSFHHRAGPELTQAGWMRGNSTIVASMPAFSKSSPRFGRALGRDIFDSLLVDAARAAGVQIIQPARVRRVKGSAGDYCCDIEILDISGSAVSHSSVTTLSASLIIDAHGSWETGPAMTHLSDFTRAPQRASDLFAFKASYSGSSLRPGFLPVLSLDGAYGGLVVSNDNRTTMALCIRRDRLRALRGQFPGASAGVAVEAYLRKSCHGVRDALFDSTRQGAWLAVGPLQPGIRLSNTPGVFRVGNAAGECHPLIGEGIGMALQASKLLVESLLMYVDDAGDSRGVEGAHRAYANAWRLAFRPKMRIAAMYAHGAMRASVAAPMESMLRFRPGLLTTAARFAGKARPAIKPLTLNEEPS